MENVHPYDEETFTTASNEFQPAATQGFENLWDAGAKISDLENEVESALKNAGLPVSAVSIMVEE